MNQSQASIAIYQQWMNTWPALTTAIVPTTGVPFVFDNDVNDESPTYARVKVLHGNSDQHSLGAVGNRRFIRDGVIQITLKTPANTGRINTDVMVAACRSVYEGNRLASTTSEPGVVCEAVDAGKDSTDGQYWSSVVTVPFTFYETR